ncbi:hypothetical protein [Azospirillum largimobile]
MVPILSPAPFPQRKGRVDRHCRQEYTESAYVCFESFLFLV